METYYHDKHKLNGIKFAVQTMQMYDEAERRQTDILCQMSWFLPQKRPNAILPIISHFWLFF